MIGFPYCVYFCSQNRDMGPKYGRVTTCGRYMVGWPRIEHKAYVAFPSYSHHHLISRICACEGLTMVGPLHGFHLNCTT